MAMSAPRFVTGTGQPRGPGLGHVSVGANLRARASTAAVCRVALLGIVLVLTVIAYYPFSWSPPRTVPNEVTRSADGSLRFGTMNYARAPGTPAWLQEVRASGTIQIEADPQSLQQAAPLMILASDYWHGDFSIAQVYSNLGVWLRRPGSDAKGEPPFFIDRAFQPRRWNSVTLVLRHGSLRIDIDGRTRLAEHLAADSTSVWSPGQIALGDEVHG